MLFLDMEKIIELKSIELADMLGVGDQHIKLIESSIPVSISARGGRLSIKGNDDDIQKVDSLFEETKSKKSPKHLKKSLKSLVMGILFWPIRTSLALIELICSIFTI